MPYLLPAFKAVSIIFAVSAVATGVRAIVDPVGFTKSFGIPIDTTAATQPPPRDASAQIATSQAGVNLRSSHELSKAYVSLMGVRQLGTGLTLLLFAYQQKWRESATILSTIGLVVAGTDGYYLTRFGAPGLGRFHAIPGALIAVLAGVVLYADL